MIPAVPLDGGCNCGAIRYRVTAAPLTAYICHCHLCQKRTGAAFSFSMVFPKDALEFTAGSPARTERLLPNGDKTLSLICAACHSRIHTRRESWPTLNLRAGTLDDTSWVRPVAQMWVTSAQPWAIVPGILTYDEQPLDFAEVLRAGRRLVA